MTARKILITVLLIALAVPAFGQRGAARGDVQGGDTVLSGRSNRGPGAVGLSPDNNSPAPRKNPNFELQLSEKLAAKLKTLLPEDVDPHRASKGFENLKDFVAAVRVANNLNVSFVELKRYMADGSNKELQKAIHALKPDADPKAELKKASEQAKQDIKESKES